MFDPSDRQMDFALVAQWCYRRGWVMPADWVLRAGNEPDLEDKDPLPQMEDPLTMSEWNAWLEDDDFWGWWQTQAPWTQELDRVAVAGLDHLFWSGLGRGMAMGESYAFSTYAKMKSDEAMMGKLDSATGALQDWLTQRVNPWTAKE
ncbi:MAG: hypothetical protein GY913_21565 [Proteobacteria bacterium]|nr:hypothetical protein [Actinomycetes bacterium]MCP4919498.1 hypothetical protein [Pseudomonadota bacterium]